MISIQNLFYFYFILFFLNVATSHFRGQIFNFICCSHFTLIYVIEMKRTQHVNYFFAPHSSLDGVDHLIKLIYIYIYSSNHLSSSSHVAYLRDLACTRTPEVSYLGHETIFFHVRLPVRPPSVAAPALRLVVARDFFSSSRRALSCRGVPLTKKKRGAGMRTLDLIHDLEN